MNSVLRFIFFALFPPLLSPLLAGAEVDTRGAKIGLQIVSEVTSIQPGRKFTVGLHLRHDPEWHTYWRYPGIVGVPTSLDWELPQGFSAGAIQWPNPELVKMAVYTAYGYERETVLLVDIVPPSDLKPGSTVTLKAKSAWMACAKTCHPGWGEFELKLPVSATEPTFDSLWHAKFNAERADFATALKGWKPNVSRTDKTISLELTPETRSERLSQTAQIYVFSEDGQIHSDRPQELATNADGSLSITMIPHDFGPKSPKTFPAIVYNSAGWSENGGSKFARVVVPWK